jgi:imidazolonepropionase-like amidohydrolase
MTQTLIHNGTLIDGNGSDPISDGSILIEDNVIKEVGSMASISAPSEVKKIDAGGGTILPGLIDTHVHLMFELVDLVEIITTPFSLKFYQAMGNMRRTLDAGITSVRDAAGLDLGTKKAVEQGLIEGPRIQISITALSTTGGHVDFWLPSGNEINLFPDYPGSPDGICDGIEDVRKKVREVLRAGAEVIKVCSTGGILSPTDHPDFVQFTQEELEVMVQEGEFRNGIKVMSHAQGAEGINNAVRAGIHSIEHGIYLNDESIELMLEHGTYLVPTLLAGLSIIEMSEAGANIPEWGVRKAREALEAHKENIGKAHKAGVKIAMGTDAGVMHHGTNLREMGLMCDVGMTSMESIVATTRTAAECLGWEDQVGTLERGKLADLVISKTDPLADIRSLENNDNISFVMKDGQVIKNLLQ